MSELLSGERQVAASPDQIRRDHRARYEWVARREGAGSRIVDAACGIGYGSKILAGAGASVVAFDHSEEALDYARQHYNHDPGIEYRHADLVAFRASGADAVVCFEALEHVADPDSVLANFRAMASRLYVSVPNEDVFPFRRWRFHHRHYTATQLEALLNRNGWEVREWWGQKGQESDVEPRVNGRTLVAVCARSEHPAGGSCLELPPPVKPIPESVAIVAMGMSAGTWLRMSSQLGDRAKVVDEVWAINAMAGTIQHDRVFHMDDMRLQELRAEADPASGVAGMCRWLRRHAGPVYTSTAYPEFPGAVEYPLAEVMTSTGHSYFNNTIAYAVAYAIHVGVRQIQLYGCDYTYPDSHKREKGRGCLEFWMGLASARGVNLVVAGDSTLMDANDPASHFYGYDGVKLDVSTNEDGFVVRREPKPLPTVEEIERRYSHEPDKEGAAA
jgi:SAM-dependent methyltransferase